MRHFRIGELAPQPLAVARLTSRMEAAGPGLAQVCGARAAEGLAAEDGPADGAEPLAPVAPAAEAKLDPTARAEREAVGRGRHEAPCRRFLDMEPGLW
jgi:hypothetical protein